MIIQWLGSVWRTDMNVLVAVVLLALLGVVPMAAVAESPAAPRGTPGASANDSPLPPQVRLVSVEAQNNKSSALRVTLRCAVIQIDSATPPNSTSICSFLDNQHVKFRNQIRDVTKVQAVNEDENSANKLESDIERFLTVRNRSSTVLNDVASNSRHRATIASFIINGNRRDISPQTLHYDSKSVDGELDEAAAVEIYRQLRPKIEIAEVVSHGNASPSANTAIPAPTQSGAITTEATPAATAPAATAPTATAPAVTTPAVTTPAVTTPGATEAAPQKPITDSRPDETCFMWSDTIVKKSEPNCKVGSQLIDYYLDIVKYTTYIGLDNPGRDGPATIIIGVMILGMLLGIFACKIKPPNRTNITEEIERFIMDTTSNFIKLNNLGTRTILNRLKLFLFWEDSKLGDHKRAKLKHIELILTELTEHIDAAIAKFNQTSPMPKADFLDNSQQLHSQTSDNTPPVAEPGHQAERDRLMEEVNQYKSAIGVSTLEQFQSLIDVYRNNANWTGDITGRPLTIIDILKSASHFQQVAIALHRIFSSFGEQERDIADAVWDNRDNYTTQMNSIKERRQVNDNIVNILCNEGMQSVDVEELVKLCLEQWKIRCRICTQLERNCLLFDKEECWRDSLNRLATAIDDLPLAHGQDAIPLSTFDDMTKRVKDSADAIRAREDQVKDEKVSLERQAQELADKDQAAEHKLSQHRRFINWLRELFGVSPDAGEEVQKAIIDEHVKRLQQKLYDAKINIDNITTQRDCAQELAASIHCLLNIILSSVGHSTQQLRDISEIKELQADFEAEDAALVILRHIVLSIMKLYPRELGKIYEASRQDVATLLSFDKIYDDLNDFHRRMQTLDLHSGRPSQYYWDELFGQSKGFIHRVMRARLILDTYFLTVDAFGDLRKQLATLATVIEWAAGRADARILTAELLSAPPPDANSTYRGDIDFRNIPEIRRLAKERYRKGGEFVVDMTSAGIASPHGNARMTVVLFTPADWD